MKADKPRKKGLKIFIIVSSITIGSGIGIGAAVNILKAKFKHIDVGITQSKVEQKLGKPSLVSPNGDYWYYFENRVAKKFAEKEVLEQSGNDSDLEKARSIGDKLNNSHFVARIVGFDSDNLVNSYFYNINSRYNLNGTDNNLCISWKEKEQKSLTHTIPDNLPCYKYLETDGISYYKQVENEKYQYEIKFDDMSLCRGILPSDKLIKTKANNSNIFEGSWSFNDEIKVKTELNLKAYTTYIQPTSQSDGCDVSGGGYCDVGNNVTLRASLHNGYTSAGWYEGSDSSTQKLCYEADYTFKVEKYGFCTYSFFTDLITYTIFYELNGGANDPENRTTYTVIDEFNLKDASKDGYVFLGWFNSNNNQVSKIRKGTYGDLYLEARFEGNSYEITLDPNGGQLEDTTRIFKYSEDYALPSMHRDGYTFDGWYYETTLVPNTGTWSYQFDLTLVAHYSLIHYSITYNLDGGTNSTSNPNSFTINDEFSFFEPVREGYEFAGWYDDNYTEISHLFPGTTGDLVLNAHWNSIAVTPSYSVTFEPNGGTTSITEATYYADQYYELPIPTKPGYEFTGWYVNDTYYLSDTGWWDIYYDVTLYARWQIIYYSISYEVGDGINSTENPSSYTIEDEIVFEDGFLFGHTFLGWYDENDELITSISPGHIGDICLTGHWNDGDSFTITLDPDGGTVSQSSISVKYSVGYTLPIPTREGYSFDGWYEGEVKYNNSDTWYKLWDITLVARWNVVNYSVSYELDGGSLASPNPSIYNINTNVTLNNPTKSGYTFTGWYDQNSNQVEVLTNGFLGNLTLTAHWSEGETFVVTLDPAGGSVDPTNVNVIYGQSYTLPVPSRTGYNPGGWFDGGTFVNYTGTWLYEENKTLQAHWNIKTYNITYNLNGGSLSSSNPSTYTIEDNFAFNNPTKAGYYFVGWFVGEVQKTGISLGEYGNLNLEARWSPVKNTLTVLSSNTTKGSVTLVSGEGYTHEDMEVLATPYGDNVFMGWYDEVDRKWSAKTDFEFKMPVNDLTLTAVFMSIDESLGIEPIIDLVNMTITYGLYPQSKYDSSADDDLVHAREGSPDERGWYTYNNRYFVKRRDSAYSLGIGFDDGTRVEPYSYGVINYYNCEPIKWDIIYSNSTYYLLNSSKVLDCYFWQYEGSEDWSYSNSYLRTFLKDTFYNCAFKDNNSYLRTYYNYSSSDYVSTLSKDDYLNESYGYSTSTYENDSRRRCRPTDYARGSGVWTSSTISEYCAAYFTRTGGKKSIWYILGGGSMGKNSGYPIWDGEFTWTSYIGVRPNITFII